MYIIDAHCHYGPGDGFSGPWDARADLHKYESRAGEAGIDQTVIFPAFHSNYAKANAYVAQKVRTNPRKWKGFAFVHAQRDAGRIALMIQKAVVEYGFCGIKVHRHDASISREICQVAQAYGLPILYDVMGKVNSVELLAREYPKVNFIIPHLGSFADDWNAQISFIPILARHSNIFTDTSGVRRFDLLEMALKEAGAHKILFGSDGPWLHPGLELEKVYALPLRNEELALVLSKNFLRLTKQVKKEPGSSAYYRL